MAIYLDQPSSPSSTQGMHRLGLVAQMLTREDGETVDEIAKANGWSRQGLYLLAGMAAAALEPRSPGPVAGWREEQRLRDEVDRLGRENDELRARIAAQEERISHMVEVSERRRDQLELVCFSHHVSLRSTQHIDEMLGLIAIAWEQTTEPACGQPAHHLAGRDGFPGGFSR